MATDGLIRTMHLLTSLERRGAETFAIQLVDRLPREAFLPSIWTINPLVSSAKDIVPQRTVVLSSSEPFDRPVVYRTSQHLVRAMRAWRPHLVQCHGGRALKYAMILRPFWSAQVYVYTKIGSFYPWLDPLPKRLFYGFLLEQPDAIVAVGEHLRREVETVFNPRRPRVVTINTGRDVAPFLEATPELIAQKRHELGLEPSDQCLMTVGSLSWEKNPQFLLTVLRDLVPEHPRVKLVYVGEGPLEAELRQLAEREGVADRVRFAGVREDVPHLLLAADVFVLPSLTEGLPGVLIEAGMAGVPAVSFRVGSVEDILRDGKTGFTVPRGENEMFTRCTARLLSDSALRKQMGNEAIVLCRRDFDIALSVKRHEALFTELLDAARRKARGESAVTSGQRA